MKQAPQMFIADNMKYHKVSSSNGHGYVLARPISMGGIGIRLLLAWMVFTGRCDALKWGQDQ